MNIVQYLIETCHVDKNATDGGGWTALHYASSNGRLEIVQYLIDSCQVSAEAKGDDEWTALHHASSNGHLEVIKYLVDSVALRQWIWSFGDSQIFNRNVSIQ